MPIGIGTRSQATVRKERIDQGEETRAHAADKGMTKRVSASLTFGGLMATTALVAAAGGASSHNYVPGDTVTLAGGTSQVATILQVATTKAVSATVAAAGTGGTPGTQTVTGTTGTGTKFQASVTVSAGGAITAVLGITVAGSYTANPTDPTQEPVTGASLSGAKLNVIMGVATATVSTAGRYTVAPTNPVAQSASSGAGTGATFNMSYADDTVARIYGSTNTFASTFAVGDPILVENTNLNNGYKTVTGLDGSNAAYLTVDPPPKVEGPVTALIRTA